MTFWRKPVYFYKGIIVVYHDKNISKFIFRYNNNWHRRRVWFRLNNVLAFFGALPSSFDSPGISILNPRNANISMDDSTHSPASKRKKVPTSKKFNEKREKWYIKWGQLQPKQSIKVHIFFKIIIFLIIFVFVAILLIASKIFFNLKVK